jgi:hypothetical protein
MIQTLIFDEPFTDKAVRAALLPFTKVQGALPKAIQVRYAGFPGSFVIDGANVDQLVDQATAIEKLLLKG